MQYLFKSTKTLQYDLKYYGLLKYGFSSLGTAKISNVVYLKPKDFRLYFYFVEYKNCRSVF